MEVSGSAYLEIILLADSQKVIEASVFQRRHIIEINVLVLKCDRSSENNIV